MSTILFDKAVFGPVRSRRLGVSLGINLLPTDRKVCSFDCLYCECGFTLRGLSVGGSRLPSREDVRSELHSALLHLIDTDERPNVITFAGNGEPTLHPDFAGVVDDVIALRDELVPDARVAVLTNATMLKRGDVCGALAKVDDAIMKFDSAIMSTVRVLDRPQGSYDVEDVICSLTKLREQIGRRFVIQTMFVAWDEGYGKVSNITPTEIDAWIVALQRIGPERVMIYTIARETPLQDMQKVSKIDLDAIAERVRRQVGSEVEVSG